MCAMFIALHDDGRRRQKARAKDTKDSNYEEPQSKAAARVFQELASAFCRARGASDTELKAAFGKLRRRERRSGRKLLGAVRRVLKAKSYFRGTRSQAHLWNSSKKRCSTTEGWKQDICHVRGLMESAIASQASISRFEDFQKYCREQRIGEESVATQLSAYIGRQLQMNCAASTVKTQYGHLWVRSKGTQMSS
jgi:hypothetical protein